MFESMLAIAIYLTAICIPVLIPAAVHAVHLFRDLRPAHPALRAVSAIRLPRPVVSRRVPVPAMG
jgi:hypothetical protein